MPVTTLATANEIINRTAAEIGVEPAVDPWASNDPTFVQMRYLIQTAGEELARAYPWELLIKEYNFTTQDGDDGDYDLPADFLYMINQTGWDRTNNLPLMGPLSPQEWQYLEGRDLVTSTIYASFRLNEGKFKIFPFSSVPVGLDIHYEYCSKNWVLDPTTQNYSDEVSAGSDQPLYDKTLLSRLLKTKILEAKGFDSSKAQADFNQMFSFMTGNDKGAKILYMGTRRGFPYLNIWRNVPDSGFGGPFV